MEYECRESLSLKHPFDEFTRDSDDDDESPQVNKIEEPEPAFRHDSCEADVSGKKERPHQNQGGEYIGKLVGLVDRIEQFITRDRATSLA
mmetsp:Transcript_32144/g.51762  ORF Transcript_32144/g.51762 Transcript_32144/m.51762 type:complete len:90 (+) Transcript_32144:187-456(+)